MESIHVFGVLNIALSSGLHHHRAWDIWIQVMLQPPITGMNQLAHTWHMEMGNIGMGLHSIGYAHNTAWFTRRSGLLDTLG
jgi:hypothetical protein